VEIAYTNSRRDQVAHVEPLRRNYASRLAYYHYSWVFYWAVMAALGVYVSLTLGTVFIAAVFVVIFLFYAARAIPFSRVWRWSVEQTSRGGATKQIRLRVDDKGLHETVDGMVESFAPWAAVKSFALVGEHLLIELAGDLWANVPRSAVAQGDKAFDDVVALLRSRGVPEKSA